jgi:hypothetical protein
MKIIDIYTDGYSASVSAEEITNWLKTIGYMNLNKFTNIHIKLCVTLSLSDHSTSNH